MSWEIYLFLSISKDRGPRPRQDTRAALEDAGLIIVSQCRVLAILLDCAYLVLRLNQNREDPQRLVFPVQNVTLM